MLRILHVDGEENGRVLLECTALDLWPVHRVLYHHGSEKKESYGVGDIVKIRKLTEIAGKKLCIPHHERSPEWVRFAEEVMSATSNLLYIMKHEPDRKEGFIQQLEDMMRKRADMRMANKEVPRCDRSPDIVEKMEELVGLAVIGDGDKAKKLAKKIEAMRLEAWREHYGNAYDEAGRKEHV